MERDCIVPLTAEHLAAITRIHAGAFPGRALTSLGEKFITRYYRVLLSSGKFRYAVGAVEDGRLLGYLIGGEMKGVMAVFLKRNFAYLLFHFLTHPGLFAQPVVRDRLRQGLDLLGAGKLRRRGRRSRPKPRAFTVLVIAVDPEIQSRGVGRILMEDAEAAAIAGGYEQMHLSVDVDNTGAARFYERLGYHRDFHKTWRGSMAKPLVGQVIYAPVAGVARVQVG